MFVSYESVSGLSDPYPLLNPDSALSKRVRACVRVCVCVCVRAVSYTHLTLPTMPDV